MPADTPFLKSVLATPTAADCPVTTGVRISLLSSIFADRRSLLMSGFATAFVALVAFARLHEAWTLAWLLGDACVLAARLTIAQALVSQRASALAHLRRPLTFYVPLSLLASAFLGGGTMLCVMSGDAALASLAIMVTAGILGGIASKNAAIPRLAISQICLGALPIGIGALLAPSRDYWILVPPLFIFSTAMASIVRRHYFSLSALMTAEENHAQLAARFDAALTHMPHGLCTIDEAGKVIIANGRTAELFGAKGDALLLNVPFPDFLWYVGVKKLGEPRARQWVDESRAWLSEGRGPLELDLGNGRKLEMSRNVVPDGSAVIIIEDVTERRRAEAEILHWASHDPLTGLSNRRRLREQLEQMLLRQTSGAHRASAVMYLDLDGFKCINDNLGHHAGDEVLKAVAHRLEKGLRHGETVARLGGDEFAIVIERTTPAACAALARRLIEQLSRPYPLSSGGTVTIGASVGIALTVDGETLESLLERADTGLYEAKAAGKGTFRFAAASSVEALDESAPGAPLRMQE
jgi:diguanylate cyclase (GGDEF)-like protein